MAKLNRKLEHHILEESKQRTMHVVMSQINEETIPWYQNIFSFKPMIALASSIVLLLVLSLSIGSTNPPSSTVYALNEETSNTVAEMSYMASHLVAMQISITAEDTSLFQFLNSPSSTEFETSLEEFTTYFDMLKIYLNDTRFDELITYTEIDSEEFDVRINFNLDEFAYVLFLHQLDETTFDGVMVIDGVAFDVTGMIEKEPNETTFEFNAVNGENFVTRYLNELTN
jgi:hypothetical protein